MYDPEQGISPPQCQCPLVGNVGWWEVPKSFVSAQCLSVYESTKIIIPAWFLFFLKIPILFFFEDMSWEIKKHSDQYYDNRAEDCVLGWGGLAACHFFKLIPLRISASKETQVMAFEAGSSCSLAASPSIGDRGLDWDVTGLILVPKGTPCQAADIWLEYVISYRP